VIGWKLTVPVTVHRSGVGAIIEEVREQHVVGCKCRHHTGKRSQKKGRAAQTKMHQALGGVGPSPRDEETARPYTISVTVMPESKTGGQVPKSFEAFLATEWFRRALGQAERSRPVGAGVSPAVMIHGRWLLVDRQVKKP